jgi:hypothetical protein
LYETEQVLSKLLCSLSPRQIVNALDGPLWPQSADETPKITGLDRETAMEHWTKFPLKTAADLQAWHKDRLEHERECEA